VTGPGAGGANGKQRPVVLHIVDSLLRRTETFLQARMIDEGTFEPFAVGWTREEKTLELPCPSVTFDEMRGQALPLLGGFGRKVQGRLNLLSVLKGIQPDIVHAHFGWTGRRVVRHCKKFNIPLVTGFHGLDATAQVLVPSYLKRYQELFAYNEAMMVEGPALAKHLTDAGGRSETVKLLPLALPEWAIEEPERRVSWNAPVFRMLQVARFVEKKGIDVSIRALAKAKETDPNVHLTLVGAGELEAEILALIAELGVEENIDLPGFVPFDQLPELIGNSHAMIQPSRTASNGDSEGGAPTILIHTQAQGVPILGSTHADLPAFVSHGKTGLLAPVNDHEKLAEYILQMAQDREATAAMGAVARPWILRRNEPARCHRILERIYRRGIETHYKLRGGAPKPADVRAVERERFVKRWFRPAEI